MKKRIWIGMLAVLLALLLPCGTVFAQSVEWEQAEPFDMSTITAQYAMLFDLDSGTVLASKNTGMRMYPASTTKIMTCILALEHGNLSDVVTVGEEVKEISADSSTSGLWVGEELTLEQLLYGLMLSSGNDAANTIAVHIAGSLEAFVQMMNDKAAQLEMSGTHYANAHGLHDETHYTTVSDMQRLLSYAYKNETFRTIVGTKTYEVPPTNMVAEGHVFKNSNLLLHEDFSDYYYEHATGVKTGFTTPAGHCLVATAEKDGLRLGVLIYMSEEYARYSDAAKLFFYGFESYELFSPMDVFLDRAPVTVEVQGASLDDVAGGVLSLVATPDSGSSYMELSANVQKIRENAIHAELVIEPAELTVQAPVSQGQEIGRFRYVLDGTTLVEGTLTASRDVAERASVFQWKQADTKSRASTLRWTLIPLIAVLAIVCFVLMIQTAFINQSRKNQRRRAQLRASKQSAVIMMDDYYEYSQKKKKRRPRR